MKIYWIVALGVVLAACGCGNNSPADSCSHDPCHGHGDCYNGLCHCMPPFTGENCTECETGFSGYPDCTPATCVEKCNDDDDCGNGATCSSDNVCEFCRLHTECLAQLSNWLDNEVCTAIGNECEDDEYCVEMMDGTGRCVSGETSGWIVFNSGIPLEETSVPILGGGTATVLGVLGGICLVNENPKKCMRKCDSDAECVAVASSWYFSVPYKPGCIDDSNCAPEQACISVGEFGVCAFKYGGYVDCSDEDIIEMPKQDGSGVVSVCGVASAQDSYCDTNGKCVNPCADNSDCADSPGHPICDNGTCICMTDDHCEFSVNGDICADGVCSCSDVAFCDGSKQFQGTYRWCE